MDLLPGSSFSYRLSLVHPISQTGLGLAPVQSDWIRVHPAPFIPKMMLGLVPHHQDEKEKIMSRFEAFLEKALERIFGKKAENWPTTKIINLEDVPIMARSGKARVKATFFFKDGISLKLTDKRHIFYRKCQHSAPRGADINVYGNEMFLGDVSFLKNEIDTQCPECWLAFFQKHAIRCSLCGYGIIPGDPVALYGKGSPGVRLDMATFVGKDAIGCLLSGRCLSNGLFAGRWTKEGFKPLYGDSVEGKEATGTDELIPV